MTAPIGTSSASKAARASSSAARIHCSCHCKGFSYVSKPSLRFPGHSSQDNNSPRIPAAQLLDVVMVREKPHASTGGPPPENRRVTVVMIGDRQGPRDVVRRQSIPRTPNRQPTGQPQDNRKDEREAIKS